MSFHNQCHVIGVVGGKGGLGKSLLAANLACALLAELRAQVLLIDADQNSCGDQNIILGLQNPKTLDDLCRNTAPISPQSLTSFVNVHPASKLHYLAAVRGPNEQLEVSSGLLLKQLESLSRFYPYIVIDLGSHIDSLQESLMDHCTVLTVVTTPEVLALTQTHRLINRLMAGSVPSDVIKVIVNKASPAGITPQSISQSLRREVIGVIPQDDITSTTSLQRHVPFVLLNPNAPVSTACHETVRRLTGGILQKLKQAQRPARKTAEGGGLSLVPGPSAAEENDVWTATKMKAHTLLIKNMNLKNEDITKAKGDPQKEDKLRMDVKLQISKIIDMEAGQLSTQERKQIIQEVLDEALGLGPLEDLLADPGVSEIMVNGHSRIFYEKDGKIQVSKIRFTSNLQLRNIIERIVTPLGRRIDEKTPYVDARLADGSRVNAIIEPLSIDGPALTIRKFRKDSFGAEDYIRYQSASRSMMEFLRICCENGLNIVISGGTGSGKTTLLNCLSSYIPSNERIITIEDAAELQLRQEHVVRLETRPANMEGSGAVTIRDLIRNSLRMRPDRIVVGECRDGAALDMLSAMNTGHDGSMTTVHSNSPRECISRLETLCMMAGMELPTRAIREQIAGAVDLIVQISRLSDGSRRLMSITEVQGMQGEAITLQEVFCFKEKGFDKNRRIVGEFQATGLIPKFIERFEQKGIIIPKTLFSNDRSAQEAKPKTPSFSSSKKFGPRATPSGTVKKAGGSS